MQLKTYIERFSQDQENLGWNERIEIGRKHLFDFDYPFYDEDYRKEFETNIIKEFYIREIGFETEGLFKMRLETWLNINMGYYNELFESENIKYDPLTNAQMLTSHGQLTEKSKVDQRTESEQKESDGRTQNEYESKGKADSDSSTDGQRNTGTTENTEGESNTIDDAFSRQVSSDNPDSRLQLQTKDGKGVIEYASQIDETKSDNESDVKSSSATDTDTDETTHTDSEAQETTRLDSENDEVTHSESDRDRVDDFNSKLNEMEHYLQRRYGKVGDVSFSKLIQDYRRALLRVEIRVHKELQQLFMMVY